MRKKIGEESPSIREKTEGKRKKQTTALNAIVSAGRERRRQAGVQTARGIKVRLGVGARQQNGAVSRGPAQGCCEREGACE